MASTQTLRPPRKDRFRDIADRLDLIATVREADDPAGAGFQTFVAPRKGADEETLVEHFLDVSADILGLDQPLREGVAVEREHVFGDMTARLLVDIAEIAEEILAALADPFLKTLGQIGPHQAYRRIHRMIAGAAIDAEPFDLLLQHPFEQFDLPTWMHAEITHQVLLGLALPIAVPAGVKNKYVSILHFHGRRLDHFRGDDGPVAHVLRN